jgi:hypothetical protein
MHCEAHADRAAIARCGGCGEALCGACFRFTVDGAPSCGRCAYEASTRRSRRVSLAVVFFGLGAGLGTWASLRFALWEEPIVATVIALLVLGVTAYLAWSGLHEEAPEVVPREEDEPTEPMRFEEDTTRAPRARTAPYRMAARRVVRAITPRVSARTTGLVLLTAFGVSALLVPSAVHLPRWLEAELVLAAWWAIVGSTLTTLLFCGYRVRDDYAHFLPGALRLRREGKGRGEGKGLPDLTGLDGCGDLGEGCVGVVIGGVLVVAALGLAWLVVELVLPVAFLLAYGLFLAAIARVANDRHGCEGSLGRSLFWGFGWASVYLGPLALLVALVHHALR